MVQLQGAVLAQEARCGIARACHMDRGQGLTGCAAR